MNVFDLLIQGIEVQMSSEEKFLEDVITFRFRKGDVYCQRIIKRGEILEFNRGTVNSSLLEDTICREVLAYFNKTPKKSSLQFGDWVICEDGVVGRIINFYTPTASEEQIMVKTRNGKRYHAPASMWKTYQFGVEATTVYVDEFSTTMSGIKASEYDGDLLNTHGQYAVKFAQNHDININEALEHPTVKAHQDYINKVVTDPELIREISLTPDILRNGG